MGFKSKKGLARANTGWDDQSDTGMSDMSGFQQLKGDDVTSQGTMSNVSGFRKLGRQETYNDSEAFKHDEDDWGECSDSDGSAGEDSQMSGMRMLKDVDG